MRMVTTKSVTIAMNLHALLLYNKAFIMISYFDPQDYYQSHLDLYSLSGKTSYRQISWSLEAAILDVAMVVSLWNLTGTSAAAIGKV